MSVFFDILGFGIVFSLLVIVHEFGHYVAARWAKIPILVFSVGFGREIWGYTDRSGTRWRLSFWPLGGYVRLYGEKEEEEPDEMVVVKEGQKGMNDASAFERLVVSLGGVTFNFLAALFIFWVLFLSYGKPIMQPLISKIVPHSIAEKAGLKAGDIPVAIDAQKILSVEDFLKKVSQSPNKNIRLSVLREGEEKVITLTPEAIQAKNGQKKGHIGIYVGGKVFYETHLGFFGAFSESVKQVLVVFQSIFKNLGTLLIGQGDYGQLGGVITVAQVSGQALQNGFASLLAWIALFSVNLAAVNLLPIPVLDGGIALFAIYELVFGRKPPQQLLNVLGYVGIGLIILLMFIATRNDFLRLGTSFF